MNRTLQFSMLLALLLYFITLFFLLKKNKVTLKYSLLWLFIGCLMLLITIFPNLLEVPLHMLGVSVFTNGLFAVILFFLIMIVMSLTMILSDMSEKQRDLVQKISLYEFRLRELEKKGKE